MINFVDIPPETIEGILLNCDPLDVASFAQTSRFFRSLIYQSADQHLWRVLYLRQPFDDPRKCASLTGKPRSYIHWKGELQRIIRTRTVVGDPTVCRPGERSTVLSTLLDMVCNVPPLPTTFSTSQQSENLLWVAAMLRGGKFLGQSPSGMSSGEQQQLARLHSYFGLTIADIKPRRRVESRAFVYSMRNYKRENDFGPFMMDGSGTVNWVHVQALHHVVSMHIVDFDGDDNFEFTIFPMSLPFIQPVIPEGLDIDQEKDWAGVAGMWTCSFCFCDHRELMVYNDTAIPESEPLDPTIFEKPEFEEVFRSLEIQIHMVETAYDHNHPTRPKIRFVGQMEHSSMMNGWVQMTPDDQIKWHFVSGDQGVPVWSSQGVQVGGVRSAFGVLGSWTTMFHEVDDPVGPFWLRKNYSQL